MYSPPSPVYQPYKPAAFSAPQSRGRGKRFLAAGCLAVILLVVISCFAGFVFYRNWLASSNVFQSALALARANPEVVRELGEPIEAGWFVYGFVREEVIPEASYAWLRIPFSGPRASGKIEVDIQGANQQYSELGYSNLAVLLDGGARRIDIMPTPREEVVQEMADINSPPASPTQQASPGASHGTTTISGGVLNGRATSKPDPVYPPAVRASGIVVVQVLVDEEGRVTTATAISGHPLLRPASIQAARQARFPPTRLSGRPVRVAGTLTYNFPLEQ